MKLTGNEIVEMYKYVMECGAYREYNISNSYACKNGGIGYHRYISTEGAPKKDIADIDNF